MEKLTPHFSLTELIRSDKAEKLKIDNTPTPEALENLQELANLLETIRTFISKPIKINSAYRSPKLNEAVKGSKTSAHMLGLAADITVVGITPRKLVKLIEAHGVVYDQLILENVCEEFPDGEWVHIGLSKTKNRQEKKTMKAGKYYAGFN